MAFELIVIGASWGGMRALAAVLEPLPEEFDIPMVIVQHRSSCGADLLEQVLARSSKRAVVAAHDKDPLLSDRVFVAPPDYHLLVEKGHLALSTEEHVQFARPSIDVLFQSAADAYGERVLGVLLTGANEDGAEGLARIAAAGGFTVVQNPATAARGEMPGAAIARGAARLVLELDRIGPFLAGLRSGAVRGDPA
jgi:two-component system chemotaxis response regulator CheB